MSKRFVDTELWHEDWFIALPLQHQLFWLYIVLHCDHAGVWKPNIQVFNKITGCSINSNEALESFNQGKERVRLLNNGRWYLVGFIKFQYGEPLNPASKVHSAVIARMKENGIIPTLTPTLGVGVKEKDKVKDIPKDIINNNKNIDYKGREIKEPTPEEKENIKKQIDEFLGRK